MVMSVAADHEAGKAFALVLEQPQLLWCWNSMLCRRTVQPPAAPRSACAGVSAAVLLM